MILNSQFLIPALTAAAVLLWVAVGVAWAVEHRLFAKPLKMWQCQPKFRKVVVGIALVGIVAFAGRSPIPAAAMTRAARPPTT